MLTRFIALPNTLISLFLYALSTFRNSSFKFLTTLSCFSIDTENITTPLLDKHSPAKENELRYTFFMLHTGVR